MLKTQLWSICYAWLEQNGRRVSHSVVIFKWLVNSSLSQTQGRKKCLRTEEDCLISGHNLPYWDLRISELSRADQDT